jgi:FkbM family methyltransferase
MMDIPIIIISFNNHRYVKNTINQLESLNPTMMSNIIIMDNNSSDVDTINYLTKTKHTVVRNTVNKGPWIEHYPDIYKSLPNQFIITDPDLEFNRDLPKNFIEIMSNLSNRFGCHKIGFALDISDFDQMYSAIYYFNSTIYDWEKKFWNNKIDDVDFELYHATIDTTFCLINKQASKDASYKQMRIAGNFTAKHLPWYRKNLFYNEYEKYIYGINSFSNSSTMSKLFLTYINDNYSIINKNDEKFLINNSIIENLDFWKNIYPAWEPNTFAVFDKYLQKDKVFIDIGSWIGTTSMYGCRKSKHVYSIEADNLSIKDLSLNLSNNCINNNYTVINKAVFSKDNATINFGKNMFMKESRMNDSTSQIHNKNLDYSIQVKTITIDSILNNHNIKPSSISLIKVDIEGGEENILNDLYYLYKSHKVPIYISMHYEWWKDNNLNRFSFLTQKNKDYIKNNPFADLLFTGSDIEIHTKKNKLNNIKNNKFLLSVKNLFKQLLAKTK